MAKKLKLQKTTSENPQRQRMVKIKNLKEKSFVVPLFNPDGSTRNIGIRIQGIRGQKAPIVNEREITPQVRELVKRGFLKLLPVE